MHLGKKLKFNMMIAILLCMAFVVNLGSTWAAGQYRFKAQSINNIQGDVVQNNVYTDYAYAQGSQGKYIYSPGIYNNQLSINYGFRENYDLLIRFSATYTNSSHKATDFSLNFANRDKWLLDIGSTNGLKVSNGQTVIDESQTYYDLTADSNTITGVMYYMGKLSGSGIMPIISGVNFYTSPNNSFEYIGDTLTITLTPEYVKSGEYNNGHIFGITKNGFNPNDTVFNNWISYMSGAYATAENAQYMIYNAYVYDKADSKDKSLQYPKDTSVLKGDSSGLVNPSADSPLYANTAYRYTVNNSVRSYEALTAGNRYYGGLGVYVIPNSSATSNKLITVGITIRYVWQKDGNIAGFSPSGIVSFKTSSDITTITKDETDYYYYKSQISGPTYINVLDYIMLTAENYDAIIKGGYSLILNYISVSLEADTSKMAVGDGGETWSSQAKESYTVHNSTNSSQLLARVSDVLASEKAYEADISVTNNSDSILKVKSFSVKGYLWYSAYTTTSGDVGESVVEHFVEMPLGGVDKSKCYLRPSYLTDQDVNNGSLSANNIWNFDSSSWSVSYSNNIYTFSNINGAAYIPSGYTMTLISGVTIPQTIICQNTSEANDFWCSIEVVEVNTEISAPTYTSSTSTTGVETIVEGYYTEMTSTNPGKIYIRNNTNQEITKLVLSNNINSNMPIIYSLTSGTGDIGLPRDRLGSIISSVTITNHLNKTSSTSLATDTISIKPNETVLAYTITPTQSSIIYDYKISATLNNVEYNNDIKLVYNTEIGKGEVINNSAKFYEFRLRSEAKISNLANSNDFIEKQNGTTYYYYYKGVICPNQCITIIDGVFAQNVTIGISDKIEHNDLWDISHYTAENYVVWNLAEDDEWLTAMKAPFTEPTTDERQNAVKVN